MVPNPSPEQKRIFGLERNIFFIGLTSFLTDTTTKMIYAVMPLFLLTLGASKTELALIEGIAESTASILKALSGWWSDKIKKNKPFMLVGYFFTAALSPLFAFAATPLHVLGIRFAERVGKGIRTAPRDSLIAASTEDGGRGRGFGFHKAMDNSGAILGPLLAAGVLFLFPGDYRKVFIVAAIPAAFGVFSILVFVKERQQSGANRLGKLRLKDFSGRYYAFLGIVFIFTLGNSTDALLLVKAGDLGVQAEWIPMLYLVFNGVSVLFSVPAGILSDRIGRERLIIAGYLLYAGIYFGFGRVVEVPSVVILFGLYGIYSALTDGTQKALVSDLVHQDLRGTGLGLYNSLIGMTLLPASLIAGILYDRVDSHAPFYFGAGMAALAALLMMGFYAWSHPENISGKKE